MCRISVDSGGSGVAGVYHVGCGKILISFLELCWSDRNLFSMTELIMMFFEGKEGCFWEKSFQGMIFFQHKS